MVDLFLCVLKMSIAASFALFIVILFRVIFKHMPKSISVFMFELAGLRLIFPYSFKSIISLIPSKKVIESAANLVLPNALKNSPSAMEQITTSYFDKGKSLLPVFAIIWIFIAAIMLAITLFNYVKTHMVLKDSALKENNIFYSNKVSTAFVFGLIKPKIYLPCNLSDEEAIYVITHEKVHIKRLDHITKIIGFIILCVHWYNPVIWLSYILLSKDIELACDEKVIRKLNINQKADYLQTLLNCSVKKEKAFTPILAFGEVSVKDRIKSIIKYKEPNLLLKGTYVFICAVMSICLLTDPIEATAANTIENIVKDESIVYEDDTVIIREYYTKANDNLEIEVNIKEGERLNVLTVAGTGSKNIPTIRNDYSETQMYFKYSEDRMKIIVDVSSFYFDEYYEGLSGKPSDVVAVRLETKKI